ncbi:MAG: MATE family efflux transporter [Anaerolineales bacterium]|uniref:MATE family efflux transporter n=1 Tax=Candidatus Desulfolinea nitratireducens TaxID=2841698 RepID=A0A8J6TIP8_9CHLR|nr:MATE family efflux transporter [Candidatus Desulfolinea nitratireducens]
MKTLNHPFTKNPHRTLLALSFPVLISMTAEPLTALIDTAFVASLGSVSLAALGVGITALSSLFWIFNFLNIGAQTEVAQAYGKGHPEKACDIASLSLTVAVGFGLMLILLILPSADWLAGLMGASDDVQAEAVSYMQIRAYGAPAVLLMMVSFGVLRGLQDMRTPLWIALGMNALNILLDWMMIFGNGPFPAMGVAGSALASTISQWLGALVGVVIIARKLGLTFSFAFADLKRLLSVGGDLFVRTGLLTFFLAFTTRSATRIGADAGAAHQAIRQVFLFTGLALDAYASTVQSLVGYFVGQDSWVWAKKVVVVGAKWSLWTGFALGALMWFGRDLVIDILIPASAVGVFLPAWAISSLSQPINSIAFLTDGAHWGTGDFRYLRNAMIVSALIGLIGVWLVDLSAPRALMGIWIAVSAFAISRATFGFLRVWPGIWQSPFRD